MTAAGRTSDGSGGQVRIYGQAGVEMMGNIYAGVDRRLLWDGEGNLVRDTLDWDESVGGHVTVESEGLVMIGGLAANLGSEVVLAEDVELDIEFGGLEFDPVTLHSATTSSNTQLAELAAQLEDVINSVLEPADLADPAASGGIAVEVENNRLLLRSNDPFTVRSTDSSNLELLGFLAGDLVARSVAAETGIVANGLPDSFVMSDDVTLRFNDSEGEALNEVILIAEETSGFTSLDQLLSYLNEGLNGAGDGLEDIFAEEYSPEGSEELLIRFISAYDFRLSTDSINAALLGFTVEDESGTLGLYEEASVSYERAAEGTLLGAVVETGGYIQAKDTVVIRNLAGFDPDIALNSADNGVVGVRIPGGSEITTYNPGSSITIDSMGDAEIEGHLVAGGEIATIRDAVSGTFVGTELHNFGASRDDTSIQISAEHQVRIGTGIRAGGQIRVTGGDDPRTGSETDPFNFTGSSILVFGSATLETWGENSEMLLEGSRDVQVLTMTHAQEIVPASWAQGPIARVVGEGEFVRSGVLAGDVVLVLERSTDGVQEAVTITAESTEDNVGGGATALFADIQAAFDASTSFQWVTATWVGASVILEGDGDFRILPTSQNLDLLGLAEVTRSIEYYGDAQVIADVELPESGQLVADVTLISLSSTTTQGKPLMVRW